MSSTEPPRSIAPATAVIRTAGCCYCGRVGLLTDLSTDLLGRFDGPLNLRLVVQPITAVVLATRDGLKDARAGRRAFGWTLLSEPAQRGQLIADAWTGIWRVFVLSCVLDLVYQLIVWRSVKALQAVIVASILAGIPYLLIRGPANRMAALAAKIAHRKPDDQ